MLCSCGHSLLPSTHAPVGFEGTRPHGVPPTSGSSCTASSPFSSSQLWRVSALGPGLPLRLSPHSALRGSHPVRGFKCHRRADCPLGLRPPCRAHTASSSSSAASPGRGRRTGVSATADPKANSFPDLSVSLSPLHLTSSQD